MVSIIDLQLKDLYKRLAARGITVEIAKTAKEFLADHGFDEKYGARPLRRTLQRYVEDPLAEEMLRGNYPEGTVVKGKLDKKTGQLVFTAVKPKTGNEEQHEEAETHEE